jgi:hypothetical protein
MVRAAALVLLLMAVVAADIVAQHGMSKRGRKLKLGRSSSQMDLAKLAQEETAVGGTNAGPEVAALRGGGDGGSDEVHDNRDPVLVRFAVECVTVSQYEDVQVGIVGGVPELGLWTNVIPLDSEDWPVWNFEVILPAKYRDETIEYKYVKVAADGTVAEWEPGKNR